MRVLLMLGVRKYAIKIAGQGINISSSLGLTEHTISFLLELRRDAALSGKLQLHQQLQRRLTDTLQQFDAEQRAQFYVERLSSQFARSKSPKPAMATLGYQYAEEIKRKLEINWSLELELAYYRALALSHQIAHRFEEAATVCEDAVRSLKSSSREIPPLRIGEFVLKRLVCEMLAKNLESALHLIEEATEYFINSTQNRLLLEEYRLLIHLHRRDWSEALSTLQRAQNDVALKVASDIVKDRWQVYRLYCEYLTSTNTYSSNSAYSSKEVLEASSRLLSRVGASVKQDKAGLYFSVHVLRILILFKGKDYPALVDAIANLSAYSRRHISIRTNGGAHALVHWLERLLKNDFLMRKDDEETAALEEQLRYSLSQGQVLTGFQVIPYSEILDLIQEYLRTKK